MLKVLVIVLVALLAALALASRWLVEPLGLPAWLPTALAAAALALAALAVTVALVRRALDRRRGRRAGDPSREALRAFVDHELQRAREAAGDDPAWALVLGPSGAGKSAALLASGLRFRAGLGPERFVAGGAIQATDRVAFYLAEGTPSTILVDTSGRYVDGGPADEAEWRLVIEALAAGGPRRPLGAIVALVDAPALLGGDPAALGEALRRRIDEVQAGLGVVTPITLVVAKVDALVGFARLAELVGADALGLTLEVAGPGADAARGVVERELRALVDDLGRAAFDALDRAPGAEARGEVLRGLAAIERLGEASAALAAALVPDHGAADAPILRTIAWASAGELGRRSELSLRPAIDLVMAAAEEACGRPPRRASAAGRGDAPALSLARVFGELLPGDRWIAGWSRRRLAGERWRRGLAGGAAIVACAGLGLGLAGAARGNHRLVGAVIGGLHGLDRAGSGPGLIAARDLAPLQEAVHTLETHAAEGPPWSLRWGLYQGDALVDEASELYLQTLASRVITPLAAASEEELQRLARRSRGGGELARDEYWQAVRTLRLYILLTREGEAVHVLSEGERRWLAPALARAWGGAEEADPLTLAASEALVERDLPRLGAGGDAARGAALPARDPRIVERARVILRRSARGRLWVDDLADRPLGGGEAIRIASFAPSASWLQNQDRKVRSAFTRPGWADVHRLLRCEGDPQVGELGEYLVAAEVIDERGCQEELEALHAAYFAAYVREWNHFLDTMHVVEPEGYEAIRALIEDMTITGGPTVNALEGLFLKVADNALLDPHPGEGGAAAGWLAAWASRGRGGRGGGAGGAQASVKSVRDALEPFYRYGYQAAAGEGAATTPLQAYASLLMRIGGPLGEHARTRDAAALEQARKHAADVFRLLYEEQLPIQHPQWRPVLERLLEPPIRGLLEEVRRGERDLLTQRWCNEVHGPFEAMKICYPFARDGACNASASEVAELFHPKNGALWRLYEEALSGRFPFQGDRYGVAAQGYGSRLRLNPQVAELLTHAKELGEVLFPGVAAEPRFAFSILFQPSTTASKITLDVDGSLIEYNNNHRDTFRPMVWPGGGGAPGATIVADTHMGEQRAHGEGFWGLFKLLEQGDVDQEQRFIRVRMRVGAAKDVQFTINPESGLGTPLFGRLRPDARLMDVFRAPRLQVPRNLFIGGMSCPSQLRPASPATSSP